MDLRRGHLLTSEYKKWQIACQVFSHSVRIFFLSDRFPFHSILLLSLNFYHFFSNNANCCEDKRVHLLPHTELFFKIDENVCGVQISIPHFKVISSVAVMISCHRPQWTFFCLFICFHWTHCRNCSLNYEGFYKKDSKRRLYKDKWSCQDGHLCKKKKKN